MTHLSPTEARRVFLVLTFTRWFPVGLTVAVLMLFQLERGQSIAQALTVSAVSGTVTLLLELPTSGFADGFGCVRSETPWVSKPGSDGISPERPRPR